MILFFHGFLGTHRDWEEVADLLPEYGCLGLDLPGHGTTPFTKDFFDLVPEFREPIHLVGYSMGGRLALQYAQKFPQKIAGLVIMGAHFGYTDEKTKQARFQKDLAWAHEFMENPIDEVLLRWYDQSLFKTMKIDLTTRKKQNIPELVQALLHYSVAKQPFIADPPQGLYLVGEHDLKYRGLYRNIPHRVIPSVSHAVHLENPQAVAQEIRNYLCSIGNRVARTPI